MQRALRTRALTGLGAVVIATTGLLGAAASADADVIRTFPAKTALDGRRAPGDPAGGEGAIVDQYAAGQDVPVRCQQEVGGELWDGTTDGTYVPDRYVTTGTDGRVDGLPDCGVPVAAPPVGAPQAPQDDFDHRTYGFAADNCTAFAAYRVRTRTAAADFQNEWRGQVFGDAGHWDDAARAAGVRVDETPEVGAVVVNDVHVSSSDGVLHGHVATISAVHPDGTFDVEEYNWAHTRAYGTRTGLRISEQDDQFQHVLHF